MRYSVLGLCVLVATTAVALTPPPYERVLVPLSVADAPGANGSLWTTEFSIVNGATVGGSLSPRPCIAGTGPLPCLETILLPPNRTVRVPPFGTPEAPGVLFLVSAWTAPVTSFTLHVRDLSRQGESWGAEVPVVRERDFFTGMVNMTSIPFGADYRQTLRVYALLDNGGSARFRVKLYAVEAAEDRLLREEVITLDPPPPPPPNRLATPLAQTTITALFAGGAAGATRVRVSIEPVTDPLALAQPHRYWAFVSVTNNVTQQVTTITPR
ncbi:MAG TPA: hypothetical protein VGF69_10205 [Thermoanaerobaculia bacterium]|jgi:hypothetical protein